MPPLDAVIVSHDHYDHLAYPTIRELAKIDVPFATSLGVGAHLEASGVRPDRFTGLTTQYREIRGRLGPFDLVMLEVGAFHPSWRDVHLGPHHALEAYALLGGGTFLPVHWGTFSLAMHAWDQPAEVLLEEGPKAGAQLLMPRLGEPVEPAHADGVKPWWRVVD